MKRQTSNEKGSTLVVTIIVVATLLVLLGVAVDYTTQVSRNTQRSRKTALAMEIADGHLETLFTNWRNIYRTTWTSTAGYPSGGTDYSLVGTNYFYTPMYAPAPAPTAIPQMSPSPGATPPQIPLPASSNFPTEANYTVTQYRIQAVDPMITLDSNGNALVESNSSQKGTGGYIPLATNLVPPAAFGPNQAFGLTTGGFPYSFFYLAAVDVSVPALTGSVTAKVRRVFEKKFDLPWAYAMFYVDDLELQPSTPLTLNGPIHTNGSLYIGTSNFTAANPSYASPTPFPTSGRVEYGADYVNGYSPKDPRYPGSGFTAPNFAKSSSSLPLSDCPPSQVSPYLPFGWNLKLNAAAGGGTNDDSYHEIIERPATSPDPLANVRYYSQPGYRIVINADTTVTITRINGSGTVTTLNGSDYNAFCANNGQGTSSTVIEQNKPLYDRREGAAVKVTNIDISKLVSGASGMTGWTGLLYLADAGAATYNADGTVKTAGTAATVTINSTNYSTTKRAFRLINGYAMPSTPAASPYPATNGLTIVSENPVYIQGNYNTATTSGATVPSNNGTYTDPDANSPSYARKPAAVIADAITVLSLGWSDSNSAQGIGVRGASANLTINAALVSGNVPSNGTRYSGGGENFIRLLENWSSRTFCYYGSMVQLYPSNQAIGAWNGDGTVYVSPQTDRWYYDYATLADAAPPGSLQIAAYLQQQRWYQVY